MSGIQTLLTIVVISLTVLLIVVGVQVLLVIMDMRRSIKRLNNLLEDALLGGGLIRPDKLTNLVDFFRRKRRPEGGQQI
jgi:hypothetical protein